MRLIDADALVQVLDKVLAEQTKEPNFISVAENSRKQYMVDFAKQMIGDAPTVDPVKHGHWLAVKGWDDAIGEIDSVECSVCHDKQDSEYWAKTYFHYCPNCGARMDEKEQTKEPKGSMRCPICGRECGLTMIGNHAYKKCPEHGINLSD